MFTILSNRQEDTGLEDSTLLVSNSQYWLVIDDDGNQLPPFGITAVDSEIALSSRVAELVFKGSIAIEGDLNKPKKKKRTEVDVTAPEVVKVISTPQAKLEPTALEIKSKIDTATNLQELKDDTIVAQPLDEKQVSSNKNIVDPN